MRVIVAETYEKASAIAADIIEAIVRENPECTLGLATGSSPVGMYQELARRCPRLRVNVADPGVVATGIIDLGRWFDPLADIFFKPFCTRPEQGAAPALAALETGSTAKLFKRNKCLDLQERFSLTSG